MEYNNKSCLFLIFHFRIELGQEPLVNTAANIFKELCYNYRDSLTAGIIVAGYDGRRGGQVYNIPLGGMFQRQSLSIGGSGSTYVYGYVDSHFKINMTQEECAQFVTNSKFKKCKQSIFKNINILLKIDFLFLRSSCLGYDAR